MRERVGASPRWRKWLRGESDGSALKSWNAPGGQGVLAVHRLGKGYRGRMVVQDVSLSVRRGEAVGLLGPNGAGKTLCFAQCVVTADGEIIARANATFRVVKKAA